MDRESLFEDFAADLTYDPRRGVIYVAIGIAAFAIWFIRPEVESFVTSRSAIALGGIGLATKGLFMFRKQSEGFEGTENLLEKHSDIPKGPTGMVTTDGSGRGGHPVHGFAQMIQDFALGPLLGWPLVHVVVRISSDDGNTGGASVLSVFVTGALLYASGWGLRWLADQKSQPQ